jgi:hypothetical protein
MKEFVMALMYGMQLFHPVNAEVCNKRPIESDRTFSSHLIDSLIVNLGPLLQDPILQVSI